MLQSKEITQITVTDICNDTGLNRSTFYANFIDIYDLADKLGQKLEQDFTEHFQNDENRIEFFRNGLNTIIQMWLNNGCAESPEEMAEIIKTEYNSR